MSKIRIFKVEEVSKLFIGEGKGSSKTFFETFFHLANRNRRFCVRRSPVLKIDKTSYDM